jgi:vacuolar iron transporter family protein
MGESLPLCRPWSGGPAAAPDTPCAWGIERVRFYNGLVTTPEKDHASRLEPIHHEHRDVSGGWLRPTVFGAMDGLVTNVSLIAGVGGGGGSQHAIMLTGLAGLAAGAFSMAAGEFISVSSQNELVQAEVAKERSELATNAAAEQIELVGMLRARGISAATARQAAAEISAHPEKALAVHTLEELGVNASDLPSPYVAAGASLVSFSIGAIIPLLPYACGFDALWVALGLSALAAIVGGGIVARLTARPFWRGALRQLVLGVVAAGVTYLIGLAVGGMATG